MPARIYQPSRNAMQSGKAKTKNWVLEFEAEIPRETDPLMGWTSSRDMKQQLKLTTNCLNASSIRAKPQLQRTSSKLHSVSECLPAIFTSSQVAMVVV